MWYAQTLFVVAISRYLTLMQYVLCLHFQAAVGVAG
jgi:hypothetical protein